MDENGRDRAGRFAVGHAGGPGRRKGFRALAAAIERETSSGLELVAWALDVFRDESRPHAERAAAHSWLADRGFGRAISITDMSIELSANAPVLPPGFDRLTHEQKLAAIAEVRARALAGGGQVLMPPGDDE